MRATFDSDQLSVVEKNLGENWYNSLVVMQSIPGNNCESIGASVGIVLRRTFQYGLSQNTMRNPIRVGAAKPAKTWKQIAREEFDLNFDDRD